MSILGDLAKKRQANRDRWINEKVEDAQGNPGDRINEQAEELERRRREREQQSG